MRRGLPILTYHAIDTSGSVIATDPSWFAATIGALASGGFRAVDLADWVAEGRPPVERGVAIAFDDGLRSTLRAADVLARHGFTATAFLVAGRMGGDNRWPGQPRGIPRLPLMGWREALGLRDAGWRLGAHTWSHPHLDRLGVGEIVGELEGSRAAIEDRSGEPCRLLAYPYGSHDRRVRALAAGRFDAAFGTRLGRASAREDRSALSRIDAWELRTTRALDALIEGREERRFRVRRTARAARRGLASLAAA
jgi:peptidoglycan/xylan/chitin deacetylase (PgdA/CDA1 family)